MNEELNQQTTEQQAVTQTGENNTTQVEGTPSENEVKTFTQEEVDKIVEKRLARERQKFENQLREYTGSPIERELSKREREVTKRELMADARSFLEEQGRPIEILELLDYTDAESCTESIKKVINCIDKAAAKTVNNALRGKCVPKDSKCHGIITDAFRQAFGLK